MSEVVETACVRGSPFPRVGITLDRNESYTKEQIQQLMAHESPLTTIEHVSPNELPFDEVTLKVSKRSKILTEKRAIQVL